MELTLKQKQAQFLFETVSHFKLNNRGLRYPVGNTCSYAAGCAIGRKIKSMEIKEAMDFINCETPWAIDAELPKEVFSLLPNDLKELGSNYLRQVQKLHDDYINWDMEGLTELGKSFLAQIIYNFKLQSEYTNLTNNKP